MAERVAIFGEDDRRFTRATEQAGEGQEFRFANSSRLGRRQDSTKESGFARHIAQSHSRGPAGLIVRRGEFAVRIAKRESRLLR